MLTRKFYLGIFISLFMMGCDNINEQPELKDPIYQDLSSQHEKTQKQIDAKLKEMAESNKEYESLPDSSHEKHEARNNIFKAKNEIAKLKQQQLFYKVSAESRQIYDRKEYLEYYKQGKQKEWPKAEERALYEQQKIADAAPKRWSRGMASEKPVEKESEKPKKSEH